MSRTLLMILMSPRVISRESPVAVRSREFSVNHERMPVCVWNVKTGTVVGMERIYAMVTPPLMIPTTKATTSAIL